MNKKHLKQLIKIFAISAAITLGICLVIAISGGILYNTLIYQGPPKTTQTDKDKTQDKNNDEEDIDYVMSETQEAMSQTVAIFGLDKTGVLTDVILVAHFDSETSEVKVIAIPRDTYVKWTESQRQLLPSRNRWVKESKINEMSSYGGLDNIRGLTINQIERILGLRIDHYVLIDLAAFRKIVDAVGGVEVDVPQNMRYTDEAGGLYINLQAGKQLLDGKKAEQLVRFRQYGSGDLGRIQTQQLFLQAMAEKVLSPAMLRSFPTLITTLFTSVKTDVKLLEMPKYYPYIEDLHPSKIDFYNLPGSARRQNGISYFFVDIDETEQLVRDLFFKE